MGRIHIVCPVVVMSTKVASLLCIAICVFATVQSTRVESKSEIVDGYLHVVFDLNDLLHNQFVNKRGGIDFGLGRGYSGSQAARHMMGMYQANYAGGPGKK